jgi:hypothetical protein
MSLTVGRVDDLDLSIFIGKCECVVPVLLDQVEGGGLLHHNLSIHNHNFGF